MPGRGTLTILSGCNGTGKGTIGPLLAARMTESGIPASYLYGPTANSAAAGMRELVLHSDTSPASRTAQALLYMAVLAEVAEQVIAPKLTAGEHIVLDNGAERALVYNVLSANLEGSRDPLIGIYQYIQRVLDPTAVLILDCPAAIALARASKQAGTDQFQQKQSELHETWRAIYLQQALLQDWDVIDASPAVEVVVDACWTTIMPRILH